MGMALKGKIVLITGASSGFGKACAEMFAKEGARLILTARRLDRLEALAMELKNVDVLTLKLDIQDRSQVEKAIENLPKEWREIDILINNAGLARGTDKIQEGEIENWEQMIDTNVKGLLYMTRAVLPGMVERNRGHVVNIGSIAGSDCYPGGNVYCATKHAVRAISKSLRIDLLGTAVRVTEIAPGAAETEFSVVRWQDETRAKQLYEGFAPLLAEDIADTVLYATTRPWHVDISEIVIYPVAQKSPHYLHRQGSSPKGMLD